MKTKYNEEEAKHIFFTSDTHFNHNKVIDFCNRPFKSIEEHDAQLIKNWNETVGKQDTIFHLGDFIFGGSAKLYEIISQLNGNIVLIRGNHDDKNISRQMENAFSYVTYQMRLLIEGKNVYLNHFPFLNFGHDDPAMYKDSYSIQLFGHMHSRPNATGYDADRVNLLYPTPYDVGVDNNNF